MDNMQWAKHWNPEERRNRIQELTAQVSPMQKELYELKAHCGTPTSPHQIVQKDDSAYCDVCGSYHGWWCPDAPNGICDYYHPWMPEPGDTVQLKEPRTPLGYSAEVTEFVVDEVLEDGRVSASGYLFTATIEELVEQEGHYCEDDCRYCHHPEERK